MWALPPKLIHAVHIFVSLHRVGPGYFASGCNGDRRYNDMEPRRAVKNVTSAKINAMENDSTWGIRRAVEGIQRMIIEATGNTRDLGSLFLYHTWVIFVIISNVSIKFWDSLTTAVKILIARKAVAIQEERWRHSKAFLSAVRRNMLPIKRKAMNCQFTGNSFVFELSTRCCFDSFVNCCSFVIFRSNELKGESKYT